MKFLSVTPNQAVASFTYTYQTVYSWQTTGILNYPATGKTYGTGHITGTTLTVGTFTFSIPFQFGNEVRLLPEPSSHSALTAGVVLLGLMGAFGARVARPR